MVAACVAVSVFSSVRERSSFKYLRCPFVFDALSASRRHSRSNTMVQVNSRTHVLIQLIGAFEILWTTKQTLPLADKGRLRA